MERLKNCPNCAGILDDFGKCQFCGSKVYDFCDIDVRSRGSRGKSYIRISTDSQIILAPVRTNEVSITNAIDCLPELSVDFIIVGDVLIQEAKND